MNLPKRSGDNMITELHYSNTNTYCIQGKNGALLFDTGWAGTLPKFLKALGENNKKLSDIRFLMISHFHPDHMGIAQEIADMGVTIAVMDVQKDYIHSADEILMRDKNVDFKPIDDSAVRMINISDSKIFLKEIGIGGEIIHTPGHSDDSVSLWLDKEKALFVGDLNPLYELEMHRGTQIADSWDKLLAKKPRTVYYGHAKTAELRHSLFRKPETSESAVYELVKKIMKLIDKGYSVEEIHDITGADMTFIQDAARMYVTHPNVDVQGILDRIEIKWK